MPLDPKQFFENYVLAPFEAWIADELCEWKAFSVVSGLNALVDHVYHHESPPKGLEAFRQDLKSSYDPNHLEDLNHIRSVAEVHKHFILCRRKNPQPVPVKFDEKDTREAGTFSKGFSSGFDTVRPQIGFPYGTPVTWAPLRPVVRRCIEFWRSRLGSA